MESDHLAVKMYMNTDAMKGYWKLNTTCLKCKEITQAFTEEIQLIKQLKVFTRSNAEMWEVLKRKCKLLSQERNKHYTFLADNILNSKLNKAEVLTRMIICIN